MRLPGIKYGPVQGLGRYSTGPGTERPANWSGVSRLGAALGNLGAAQLEEANRREAAEQYNAAWVDYLNTRNSNYLDLTSDRYKDVPIDPDDPNSETRRVSRHTDLLGDYQGMETQLRAQIAETIENTDAKDKFLQAAAMEDVKYRSSVGSMALQWQQEHSAVQISDSINQHLEAGRHDEAMKAFTHGKEAGVFTAAQQVSIPKAIRGAAMDAQIEAQKNYNAKLAGDVGVAIAYGRFGDARAAYEKAKKAGALTQTQLVDLPIEIERGAIRQDALERSNGLMSTVQIERERARIDRRSVLTDSDRDAIHSSLDDRANDIVVGNVRQVMETQGMEAAATRIDQINQMSPAQLGLQNEDDKFKLVTRLDAVMKDYENRATQVASAGKAEAVEGSIGIAEGPQDYQLLRTSIAESDMTQADREASFAKLDTKIEEQMVDITRAIIEEGGLEVGRRAIQQMNKMPYEQLGFSSDEQKRAAIATVRKVHGDYAFGAKTDAAEAKIQQRSQEIYAGSPPDRKSDTDRKAVESLFQNEVVARQVQNGASPEQATGQPYTPAWIQVTTETAQRNGWLPKSVESAIRAGLDSGNEAQVAAAAATVREVQRVAPRALDHMDAKDLRMATMVNERVRTGTPSAEAIQRIRSGLDHVPKDIASARRVTHQQTLAKDPRAPLESLIDAGGPEDPWNRAAAHAPDDMVTEFNNRYRDEFILTGDDPSARQLAYDQIRKVWGLSDMTGTLTMQKYAPEVMTSKGMDAAGNPEPWVREQFQSDMASIGVPHEGTWLKFNEAEEGRLEWFVMTRDDNGVIQLATDDQGNIVTWSPDYETSSKAEAERSAAQRAMEIAEARREREVRLANQTHIYDHSALGKGLTTDDYAAGLSKSANALNAAGIRAWEFVFDDIPELYNKLPHKKMEHIRRKAKFTPSGFTD